MNDPAQLHDAVAIVGMSCRVPGAGNVAEFWRLLVEGRDAATDFTEEELRASGIDPRLVARPDYVRSGMILGDIQSFDAHLFGLSAAEATVLDPQQRLLLECAWEALEGAGHVRGAGGRVAVYAGARISEYAMPPDIFGHSGEPVAEAFLRLTAHDKDYIATRLAYALDLRGPAVTVQTACSTSLVAVHLACQSLLNGECDLALAGGVSVRVPQRAGYLYAEGMVFSPDGRTRPFDARANGTVFGSGAGMIALRRLEDALADRQEIFAVVRGSAINNDGAGPKAAFTAPSLEGQVRVIREALAVAGVETDSISYVEAHGTATRVGDPAEVAALTEAHRGRATSCALGSVKGNIGHLVQAAGVAAIIKTALMLRHRQLVPSANFSEPNPLIDFSRLPFAVNTTHRPWEGGSTPRRAAVSSFGFGGTNAHVILEEPPASATAGESEGRQMLPLSAASESAVRELASRFAAHLAGDASLRDVCHSAQVGRAHMPWRIAVCGKDRDEIIAGLRNAKGRLTSVPRIGFLFTGQGSQYAGMTRGLYEAHPLFRATLDECESVVGLPLTNILHGPDAESLLARTDLAQPALVAAGISLVRLLRSWGMDASVVAGHSLGEITAAWAAGAITLEDAMTFAAERGRLMQSTAPGAMAAVFADAESLGDVTSIAALNAPGQTVISGHAQEVRDAVDALGRRGVRARLLPGAFAFHSPLMDPVLDELEAAASRIAFRPPDKTFISTAAPGETCTAAAYWRRQARAPVRFGDAVAEVAKHCDVMVEIGPDATLTGLARLTLAGDTPSVVPTLRKGANDAEALLDALASLYEAGAKIDWHALRAGERSARRVPLPSYPFQRRRYWTEPQRSMRPESAARPHAHPLLGARIPTPLDLVQFQAELTANVAPFARSHWIHDVRPLVFVGHMEMVRAAGVEALGGHGVPAVVEQMVVEQPLLLDEEVRRVHSVVRPQADGTAEVEIFSARPGDDRWDKHTTARVRLMTAPPPERIDLDAIRARCPEAFSVDQMYARKRARGAGSAETEVIRRVWRRDGEVLVEIRVDNHESGVYGAHPGVLDGVPQSAELTLSSREDDDLYLPTVAERIQFFGEVPAHAWAHLRRREDSRGEVFGIDCTVADDSGAVLLELTGLYLKRARRGSVRGSRSVNAPDRLVHVVDWTRVERSGGTSLSGRWLVLGTSAASEAARCIEAAGATVVLEGDPRSVDVVLDVSALDGGSSALRDALDLAKELGGMDAPPRLCVITRGAQGTGRETAPLAPAQSPLWGFWRVARTEQAALQLKLIDLDPAVTTLDDLPAALGRNETELAIRRGEAYAPRLRRATFSPKPSDAYRLTPGSERTVDGIQALPLARRAPGPGEVEIEVWASGLNFRDVLTATGRLEGPFGYECSGIVTAAGPGVVSLRPGMAVMAIAPDSFASHVVVDARSAVEKPSNLSFPAAAAAMVAYATAWHGLVEMAKLEAGERVLIHAAAGGVGQAAVQLAKQRGATVFATCSAPKRAFVRQSGAEQVMDSRAPGFAGQVRELTGGQGVEVLLNTLGGSFAEENIAALRAGGRFVELGHPSIHDLEAPAAAIRAAGGTFFNFHVAQDVGAGNPGQMQRMLQAIATLLAEGALRPIAHRQVPLAQAREAFETVLRGAHVGKLVIVHPRGEQPPFSARPDGTYLITGGTGAVGLHIARSLVAAGARSLALVARRAPGREVESEIAALDADVRVFQADVTDSQSLSHVLASVRNLRGVIHAAGVIDDGIIAQQTWERFEAVLGPKIAGAVHLDRLTSGLPLDFFVLLSSAATLWGNAGQSAYAAANTFVDQLAAARRQRGLPATSISYGLWRGAGMGTSISEAAQRRRAEAGQGLLEPAAATRALEWGIAADSGHFAVIDTDWQKFTRQVARIPPVLADLAPSSVAESEPARTDAAAGFNLDSVISSLREQVALLTGSRDALDINARITDLGLDSLSMLLLRGRVVARFGEPGTLPVMRFLEGNSITQLAAMIVDRAPRPRIEVQARPRVHWKSLTELSANGEGTIPFVLVPPFGRTIAPFTRLGRELGAERTVYGLNPLGMDGGEPHTSVEEMAEHYLYELRAVRPRGPYLLGGICAGAYVALEMAQRLMGDGQEVPLLTVFDHGAPLVRPFEATPAEALRFFFGRMAYHFRQRTLQRAAFVRLRRHLAARSKAFEWMVDEDPGSEFERFAGVLRAHAVAGTRYRARRYVGDVLLVQSSEMARYELQERWKLLVHGRVDRIVLPGTHVEVLSEDFAAQLAARVSEYWRTHPTFSSGPA